MKPTETKTCTSCILNEKIAGVHIDNNGVCNYCSDYVPFKPFGENELLKIFNQSKKKKRVYDALVPLSGGKDSTYVLYLAVRKYNLKVLTYTFDNGFMNNLAKKNIETSVNHCGCDHLWVKHDTELLYDFYRTTLVNSGEICGICGVGIERSMLRISEAWNIPLILLGHSPTEAHSFTSENIYDQSRLKAILKLNPTINSNKLHRFFIYPKLNFITSWIYTRTGRFGRKINILYYLNNPSDKEIGNILKSEMNWVESNQSDYTRHFDCLAEPFTNYIREKRFGYSRRLPQLSNMIRNKEITREKALEIYNQDNKQELPWNYDLIKSRLNLKDSDIENIGKIPLNLFSEKRSAANHLFAQIRGLIKKDVH